MNVKYLIEQLKTLPEDAQVIIQKDGEGNDYSPLSGAGIGIYIPTNTYSGEVYDPNWSAEDAAMDEDDWEDMKDNKDNRCVILWPIN